MQPPESLQHRYFMALSYRGEPFHGWQNQPNGVTVQSTIEQALSTLLKRPVPITGAGRTDAGVNARLMVAHFDSETVISEPDNLVRSLNSIIGKDISIHSIYEVKPDMHARFSAVSRTYHYYAIDHKSPFFHPLAWKAPRGLDYDAMNRAAEILTRTQDFTSFAKLHSDAHTNICHVTYARWEPIARGAWVFVITANRFLRNMVRAVVGTLVDVGRGKISIQEFEEIIRKKDRCAAGTSMPPHALYLWDITYPDDTTI
ncbi:MAG: tRNA pseudouridine(38-40) synthase TruA [Muribaculaceae bacterium]|nr:tRNA pseudouridine(38-40) synthase TruA [Muribaculaceae bacterium]